MKLNNWISYSLDELFDISSGLSKGKEFFGRGHEFLSFKDIFNNFFVPEQLDQLVDSTEKEQQKCSIKRGDIFLTRTSEKMDELGMSSVALKDSEFATFNGFSKRLRLKSDKQKLLHPEYAGFLFRSLEFRNQITSMSSMSTRASLNNEMISRLTINLPSLDEQIAISDILYNLHQKVELNSKLITKLEELSEIVFKHWFIDFEFPNEEGQPYKSSGGKMVESELGMIPEEWSVQKFKEMYSNYDRMRIPLSKREREKREKVYPYYGAASLTDYVDDYIFDGTYLLLGEDGTVINTDGSPVLQYVWGKFWVNNHAHVLKGNNSYSTEYLYLLLKHTNVESIITGAVQKKISQSNLNSLNMIKPTDNIVDYFSKLIESNFKAIKSKRDENIWLSRLRDTLLPKLLSGEIEVPVEEPESM